MNRRAVLSILIALALVGAAIGIGSYEYHAGYADGFTSGGKVTSPVAPGPYGPFWGAPYFHRGPFGVFGFVFPILFFFLIFGLVRWAFWGGWGRPYGWWRGGAPPTFDEWHRRAHEAMSENRS